MGHNFNSIMLLSNDVGVSHDSHILLDSSHLCTKLENGIHGIHRGCLLGKAGYSCRHYLLKNSRLPMKTTIIDATFGKEILSREVLE